MLKSHLFWVDIKCPGYVSWASGTVTECIFYIQTEDIIFLIIIIIIKLILFDSNIHELIFFSLQISFLASAYMSQHLSEESCSALASVTHYLYLCQFSWMLIQVGLLVFFAPSPKPL